MELLFLRHVKTANNDAKITQPVDGIDCIGSDMLDFVDNDDDIVNMITDQTCIICGTSIRARRTLSPILADIDTEPFIKFTKLLNEVDFGDFCNKPDDIVIRGLSMQDYRDKTVQYYLGNLDDIRYPNGESLHDIAIRCNKIIQMIQGCRLFGADKVLLVGHNRIFRHIAVQLNLIRATKMFDQKFPHGSILKFTI